MPGSTALTEAVATNLYKLMAYKDEYEDARLSLDIGNQVEKQFGVDARFAWKLHPPILRALGMKRKINLATCLSPESHAVAVEIASLPDVIRGYEEIKLRSVTKYRQQLESLRGRLASARLDATSEHG